MGFVDCQMFSQRAYQHFRQFVDVRHAPVSYGQSQERRFRLIHCGRGGNPRQRKPETHSLDYRYRLGFCNHEQALYESVQGVPLVQVSVLELEGHDSTYERKGFRNSEIRMRWRKGENGAHLAVKELIGSDR